MKSRTGNCTIAALFVALGLPNWTAAQNNSTPHMHHRYTIVDVGTFGGPQSSYQGVLARVFNPAGEAWCPSFA